MADIFNRTPKTTGAGFSIDSASLEFSGMTGTGGLMIQNVKIQYNQKITTVYDLADNTQCYYVAGKAEGVLQLGKLVGSAGIIAEFYTKYGDVCNPGENITISAIAGCGLRGQAGPPAPGSTITISSPIVTDFGLSMTIEDGMVSEQVAMRFASLELG